MAKTTRCSFCHRTDGSHTTGCQRKGRCKLCERRAPGKCPYHGGTPKVANGKRPTGGGRKSAKRPTMVRSANGAGARHAQETPAARSLLRQKLEEQRDDLQAEIRVVEKMLARL